MKLLWLDDYRNPFEEDGKWLVFAPFRPSEIIWVKTYAEFKNWITENGLPDGICFDHDLGDNYDLRNDSEVGDWFDMENNREYTGYDCAKWLVDYCMDNGVKLPSFTSQSANPTGRDNILGLLNNFKKIQNEE